MSMAEREKYVGLKYFLGLGCWDIVTDFFESRSQVPVSLKDDSYFVIPSVLLCFISLPPNL